MKGATGRPVLRYHGGKWRLAPWIIKHFPKHRVYVEPFGGAGSVLLRKPRSYSEVYNDLDGEIVNLFRVLRDPTQARELIRIVHLTPYSRSEFEAAYIVGDDPIEQARRTLVRSWQGFGSRGASGMLTGFRTGFRKSGSTATDNWFDFPQSLESVVERLRGVVIENRPATRVIELYDSPETLFYIDPPYVWDTRVTTTVKGNPVVYRHEMSNADHAALAEVLRGLKGMVVVSGYRCPLYDELFVDWRRVDRETFADGAAARVESLWLSPRIGMVQSSLFGGEM